jgi:hypothetical protein
MKAKSGETPDVLLTDLDSPRNSPIPKKRHLAPDLLWSVPLLRL